MADRSPNYIRENKDRIARSSIVVGNYFLPARLNGIGAWSSYEFLIHLDWNKDIGIACSDTATNKAGVIPPIDYVVEWKDETRPTLFTAGYIIRSTKEEEMTLMAIYLRQETQGYASLYGALNESRKLLDRSIKIDSIDNEIAHRFARLILEQW